MGKSKSKMSRVTLWVIIAFLVVVFAAVIFMTLKNTGDMQEILEDSVRAELISISIAAREIIDPEAFDSYNSIADVEADAEAYAQTLAQLRTLQQNVGAEYIYALKQVNGQYNFIFDTDTEDDTIFIEYELSLVHEQAFLGKETADIMNVTDEWGSYNTGAVPIWKDGKVVGIVSTDITDTYIERSSETARRNAILLSIVMVVTMGVMVSALIVLLRRVSAMQNKLFRMANYDVITGLPNRQYLMDYLEQLSAKGDKIKEPFALMFVDLDNFKKVNDGAGHDAGDELLRHIALYLDGFHERSRAFRPSAGILNVSARVGGDEFVQIVPGIASEEEAAAAAQKLLDNFSSQALDRFIEKYKVGLSIGVALFPYHSTNFNVLIKYADIAMYKAKRGTKNSYFVYNDEMGQDMETPDGGERG
ncbi:MAG: GGDEF domain-containing protein [Oscillospiraceae bacterium]|jgi:diguanylate cyclase (GGDEF)-like protein|nr:GGDEF domain-containing protein [Oscillospiraceae bacterium]